MNALFFTALFLLPNAGHSGAKAQPGTVEAKKPASKTTLRDTEYERFAAAHPFHPEQGAILPNLPAGQAAKRQIRLANTVPGAKYDLRITPVIYRWGQKPKALPAFVQAVPASPKRAQNIALSLPIPTPAENITLEFTIAARKNGVIQSKLTEAFVVIAAGKAGATAEFAGRDDKTQGDWLGKYGKQAFMVCLTGGRSVNQLPYLSLDRGIGENNPAHGNDIFNSQGEENSAVIPYAAGDSLDDKRLLQRGPGLANQRPPAAFATGGTPLVFRAEANDGVSHVLSLYLLDFFRANQVMQADIYDLQRHHLDSRKITNFAEGTYLRYRFQGKIAVVLTLTPRTYPASNALFIDP